MIILLVAAQHRSYSKDIKSEQSHYLASVVLRAPGPLVLSFNKHQDIIGVCARKNHSVTVNGTRWALSMGGLMGKITINLRHEFERKLTKGRLLLRSLLELKPNFRVNHPLQANILYSNKLRQISRMQFFILTSATLQSKQSDSIYQLFICNIFSSFKVDNSNY